MKLTKIIKKKAVLQAERQNNTFKNYQAFLATPSFTA